MSAGLVGSVRRTTIVSRDLAASLRFWQEGLGYVVWYDGQMRAWPAPGYGYPPEARVRVVVLCPPGAAATEAHGVGEPRAGMVGLLSFLDDPPAVVTPAPDGVAVAVAQQGPEHEEAR